MPLRPSFAIPLPGGRSLALGERPLVMGVLNVTPDSFAESTPLVRPSSQPDVSAALRRATAMAEAGADILDIGGESTRPGATALPEAEELARVMPVIHAVVARLPLPISIDTYKPAVARAALQAGAVIINDVSGLRYEPALAEVAAASGAGLVLMHTRGRSAAMYAEAKYTDLIREIAAEINDSIAVAEAAGVARERIIIDPGIGFAKRAEHSYGVLTRFPDLVERIGRPVLIGPSRKSFLQAAVGERPAAERDWATAAAVTAAVLAGAHILRVHAVPEMVQVVKVAEMIRRAGTSDHR